MGELWCVPWTASAAAAPDGSVAEVVAVGLGTIAPARVTRRLWLRPGEPVLHAQYTFESVDVRPLPFAWGVHPAFAVTDRHRIDLPASDGMEVGVASGAVMGEPGQRYRWPRLPIAVPPGERDAARVLGREAAVFGGHWATGLAEGWLALTDTMAKRGVAVVFDTAVFPDAWIWQVYGGWRAHHHVALEPWTSRPMDLDGAISAGRARILEPGGRLETTVQFVLFEGLERVYGIERGDSPTVF
jgi:hypothetical protein